MPTSAVTNDSSDMQVAIIVTGDIIIKSINYSIVKKMIISMHKIRYKHAQNTVPDVW
jgi:hypothetical protein